VKPTKLVWSQQFRDLYKRKSTAHKNAIKRALRMMDANLYHNSLRTQKMKGYGDIREAHATFNQVMTFTLRGSEVHLRVCCNHTEVYRNP
jgi:mRNA-degrading endonuclease YafQ of YafQ-DinJ toxin-antitoxin module